MIRSVVIGCGVVSVCHMDAIKDHKDAILVAVCDTVEERAKAAAEQYGCAYYTDYKELRSHLSPPLASRSRCGILP